MIKCFKYRLYPTKQQVAAFEQMLETHRRLYNDALAERKDAWENEQRSVTYYHQALQLKERRKADTYLSATNFSSCQTTLRRLDHSFQDFFRRVKRGQKPGHPRFKGKGRLDTVVFAAHGDGCKFDGQRVYFQHVGKVKVKLHRPVEGIIKILGFKREAGNWYVLATCELPDVAPKPISSSVGIDMGIKSFLVTSDGEVVDTPHYRREAQAKLRRLQRSVARKKRGSNRRKKAVRQLAKFHWHVANQRRDFHGKTAHHLVSDYDLITHEDLNTKGLCKTRLAKSIYDAGWGQFLSILTSKAAEAGVTVVAVNPKNTSQMCSQCGQLPTVKKKLSQRTHRCEHCGYTADRDLNAAENVLRLGLSLQALTCADVRQCVA